MSGIAGIISLKNDLKIKEAEFNRFLTPLIVNNAKLSATHSEKGKYFIGCSNIDDGRNQPKIYTDDKEDIVCMVVGNVFIEKNDVESLSAKYNIDRSLFNETYLPWLWKKHDIEITNKVTGIFNVILIERKKNNYLLFNSRFGMLPLYFSVKNQYLYFSSRLESFTKTSFIENKINNSALMQFLVFNYPINNDTFIDGINMLPAAGFIINDSSIWATQKYWNTASLFRRKLLNRNDSFELIDNSFTKIIDKISERAPSLYSSLTGGWDGRLILSYLLDNDTIESIKLYSYGKKDFKDVTIPQELAEKIDLEYRPLYLDKNYEKRFVEEALKTILLSDGFRTIQRTHYLYASSLIGEKAPMFLSGNCGSNIIKIVTEASPAYNKNLLRLFTADLLIDEVKQIYKEYTSTNSLLSQPPSLDQFINDIQSSEISQNKSFSKGEKFYDYLLSNSERKYFGAEMASYSSYIYNYSPFIDFDFIDAIVQTPFFGGHYRLLSKNIYQRQKIIKLYAHLLNEKNKDLAKFKTDRGFPITAFLTWPELINAYIRLKIKKSNSKVDPDPYSMLKGIRSMAEDAKTNEMIDSSVLKDGFAPLFSSGKKPNEDILNALSWSEWYKANIK